MKKNTITGAICLAVALAITVVTGMNFASLKDPGLIIPSSALTEVKMLSEYFDGIEGTNGDTEVYVFEGSKPGGKMLVLGGTHGNEPSGYMSAITFIENVQVEAGTVYVIPYTNRSGMTHNDPQEGSPQYIHFTNKNGEERTFRYGSRASNPIDQWPDPDVYVHQASKQTLSGSRPATLTAPIPACPTAL